MAGQPKQWEEQSVQSVGFALLGEPGLGHR